MKRLALAISAMALTATSALAADDPIAIRQALMDANAASAGVAGAMLKGDMDYNPAVAKAAIAQLHGTALAFGSFFPDTSKTGGDTSAAPKIWDDPDAWQSALDKFKSDATAAFKASGREGPADLAAFKEAILPVLGNCKSCHEDFRVKNN